MNREEVLPDIDFSGYIGEWVVICGDKVIAHDKDITKNFFCNRRVQKSSHRSKDS